jgi:hypothetical protein
MHHHIEFCKCNRIRIILVFFMFLEEYFENLWIFKRIRKLRKATVSFVMSIRLAICLSAWNNSAPTKRILIKFDIWDFRKSVEKSRVLLKSDKNNGYFTWRLFTFMKISRWILPKMRFISNKLCKLNKRHILCSVTFSRKSCRLWDNVKNQPERTHNMAPARDTLDK